MIQIVPEDIREKYFPGIASLGILRLDLPDPVAGGNKSYKLKYHLEEFRKSGWKRILSFGGAYSNHIASLAHAGRVNRIPTTGIIRGDELTSDANAVLTFAAQCGMQLVFVSREEYRRRYDEHYHAELSALHDAYVVPEGGGGEAGIRGCMEILNNSTACFDEIFIACGTGTTAEGLRRSARAHQCISAIDVVSKSGEDAVGGYGQTSRELEAFIAEMRNVLHLPLDCVYTGKALFALHRKAKAGLVKRDLLFVHTGGYTFE